MPAHEEQAYVIQFCLNAIRYYLSAAFCLPSYLEFQMRGHYLVANALRHQGIPLPCYVRSSP